MGNEYKHTIINGKEYYGKHSMFDCKSCDLDILEISIISDFIYELVRAIDMTPHGDLIIDRFGEGNDVGVSACQLILTSSITIHTNDLNRDFYLDVFSCKDYSEDVIIEMIKDYFDPETINLNVVLRK